MLQIRALQIYHREDIPENPKVHVILIHGYAEHSGRYDHFVKALNEAGVGVGRFDLPGHGKSDKIDGKRAFFLDFDILVETTEVYFEWYKSKVQSHKIFVFGHSMGGLTAAHFTLKSQNAIQGLILSAPALLVSKKLSPFLQKISGIVAKYFPFLPTISLDDKGTSRDPATVENYNQDPLNFRGKIRAITGHEILRATQSIQSKFDQFELPFLVLHGTADILTEPSGSQKMYNTAKSSDKTIKFYNGLYHELINEPEKDEVISDIVSWIMMRTD